MKELKELQFEAIRRVLAEHLWNPTFWNLTNMANDILEALREVEVDYQNRWEEMRVEEQYQEKPE